MLQIKFCYIRYTPVLIPTGRNVGVEVQAWPRKTLDPCAVSGHHHCKLD